MKTHYFMVRPEEFSVILNGSKRHIAMRMAGKATPESEYPKEGDKILIIGRDASTNQPIEELECSITFVEIMEFPTSFECATIMSIKCLGEWETCKNLRTRLMRKHDITFSAAALKCILAKLNPPGVQIQRTKNGRRIDSIRVTSTFESWLVAHVKQWRKRPAATLPKS